ncbi:MAG: tRNA preQ1(34) S-adenosylmethionine ribosyltransferase-isomerase QueA [Patescibacteria group bacterium]
MITIADYFYHLPKEKIANKPAEPRDHSKLLLLNRQTGQIEHTQFFQIAQNLTSADVLVLNQTKVFPARLFGKKITGGKVEVLLLKQLSINSWQAISRPGLKIGQGLSFAQELVGEVVAIPEDGQIELAFNFSDAELLQRLDKIGLTPLPPYIESTAEEDQIRRQYQTVYAINRGSAAAPTAGLHFTDELLEKIAKKGVQIEKITLHVGLGTFQNLRPENIEQRKLHEEFFEIDQQVAERLNQAKKHGKRIVAVGTTTTRALESSWLQSCHKSTDETTLDGSILAGQSSTQLFIFPPRKFNFVDALITNFHLPESSLLMLVSAFTSTPNSSHQFVNFQNSTIGRAYQEAIEKNYRFFSFGDAMFIS